jgi:hypothetical protein
MQHDTDVTIAELKGRLARLGAALAVDACLLPRGRPKAGDRVSLVTLDRVRDVKIPRYCVHGFTSCLWCDELCYLGSESSRVITESEDVYGVCLLCADLHVASQADIVVKELFDRVQGQH